MVEIKASIPGFPDYMATMDGEILSYKGKNRSERVLKPGKGHYLNVTLRRGGRSYCRNVHALIMLAFVGPPPPGLEVRHLNGNNYDNRLENLAYGTHSQNQLDMVTHGTHFCANKTHCKWGHEFTPENTLPQSGGRKGRLCRECQRRHIREYMRRRRSKLVIATHKAVGSPSLV